MRKYFDAETAHGRTDKEPNPRLLRIDQFFLDAQIGRVLDQLSALGLSENTHICIQQIMESAYPLAGSTGNSLL